MIHFSPSTLFTFLFQTHVLKKKKNDPSCGKRQQNYGVVEKQKTMPIKPAKQFPIASWSNCMPPSSWLSCSAPSGCPGRRPAVNAQVLGRRRWRLQRLLQMSLSLINHPTISLTNLCFLLTSTIRRIVLLA